MKNHVISSLKICLVATAILIFSSGFTPAHADLTNPIKKIQNHTSGKSRVSSEAIDPEEIKKLPPKIQNWIRYETEYLSREISPSLANASPTQNAQNSFYAPEKKNIFSIKAYWVPVEDLKIYQAEMSPQTMSQIFREHNGQKQMLFFVHPESVSLYTNLIHKAESIETYRAMATASSRSLLVWKKGEESKPMLVKVSLDKEIGHVNRTLQGVEMSASIGGAQIIQASKNLPENTLFFPEVLGAIPKKMSAGAMIVREFIPQMLNNTKLEYMPLFSLYGTQKGQEPILLSMIKKSNLPPEEFLRTKILRPFVNMWMDLAVNQGILSESHAQNLMLEVENGQPTKRFAIRDFGGLNIDLGFRKKHGLAVPKNLPSFSGDIFKDYHQDSHADHMTWSLDGYFEGGFLYNVEKNMDEWVKNGSLKVPGAPLEKGWTHEVLMEELSANLSKKLNKEVRLKHYHGITRGGTYPEFATLVYKARGEAPPDSLYNAIRARCENLFMNMK